MCCVRLIDAKSSGVLPMVWDGHNEDRCHGMNGTGYCENTKKTTHAFLERTKRVDLLHHIVKPHGKRSVEVHKAPATHIIVYQYGRDHDMCYGNLKLK